MSEKILVVDDEKEIVDLIEVYLKNDGYIVDKIVCDNGAVATWDNDECGIAYTN